MAQLGSRIAGYRTDNRKRLRTALGVLVAGAIALVIGLFLIIELEYVIGPDTPGGPPEMGPVPGAVGGVGFGGVVLGVWMLVLALRGRGEYFELHERGLVRSRRSGRVELAWTDVASVKVVDVTRPGGTPGVRDGWLRRLIGGDVVCHIRLHDGTKLHFNGFTARASNLAGWVRAAVTEGRLPRPAEKAARPDPAA